MGSSWVPEQVPSSCFLTVRSTCPNGRCEDLSEARAPKHSARSLSVLCGCGFYHQSEAWEDTVALSHTGRRTCVLPGPDDTHAPVFPWVKQGPSSTSLPGLQEEPKLGEVARSEPGLHCGQSELHHLHGHRHPQHPALPSTTRVVQTGNLLQQGLASLLLPRHSDSSA